MKVALVNVKNNLCEGVTYLESLKEVADNYEGIVVEYEDTEDYLWRKYENGVWSIEKYVPPTPIKPTSELDSFNDYIVDMDYRLLVLELGL